MTRHRAAAAGAAKQGLVASLHYIATLTHCKPSWSQYDGLMSLAFPKNWIHFPIYLDKNMGSILPSHGWNTLGSVVYGISLSFHRNLMRSVLQGSLF